MRIHSICCFFLLRTKKNIYGTSYSLEGSCACSVFAHWGLCIVVIYVFYSILSHFSTYFPHLWKIVYLQDFLNVLIQCIFFLCAKHVHIVEKMFNGTSSWNHVRTLIQYVKMCMSSKIWCSKLILKKRIKLKIVKWKISLLLFWTPYDIVIWWWWWWWWWPGLALWNFRSCWQ